MGSRDWGILWKSSLAESLWIDMAWLMQNSGNFLRLRERQEDGDSGSEGASREFEGLLIHEHHGLRSVIAV